ncbi:hypothetical protein B0H19DRAFT_1255256 [Mycena capillaripes]|nr:hypothetical protein B0H19DRAFT_1255256 [Mycena capillaripes]
MNVQQKGDARTPKGVDPAEAAAAKIWAIYAAEAEKYDKALVESWKSDMEGMLIFAGLFSASLTAFVIESYKTLNPDSGDATVRLLTQISLQFAASSNGSTYSVPATPGFTPSASALTCNALWFTSLGLSLSCALVATLLEQWARNFIHRSEIRSAPLIRARIFSFLYYGLRRFDLHLVVDIIPLLLHAALLLFLAGLVAFLIPVNIFMAAVAAAIWVIIAGVYSFLTFHPLRYLDSPYRTPLSGAFWGVFRRLGKWWRRRHSRIVQVADEETILEAITQAAIEPTEARTARDGQALIWTVKSLSDELELEPFFEAIPGTLWALGIRRDTYWAHFRALAINPEVALYARVKALLDSCDTGILSSDARKRRLTLCYRALWALATLFVSPGHQPLAFPDPSPLPILHSSAGYRHDATILQFSISAGVLIQWVHFQTLKSTLTEFLQQLTLWEEAVLRGHEPDLSPVTSLLVNLSWRPEYNFPFFDLISTYRYPPHQKCAALMIPKLRQVIDYILRTTQHNIWIGYLRHAASELTTLPCYFKLTLDLIQRPVLPPPELHGTLESVLSTIVSRQLDDSDSNSSDSNSEWMDHLLVELIPIWLNQHPSSEYPMAIPPALIQYLLNRKSDAAVAKVIGTVNMGRVWGPFAQLLLDATPGPEKKSDVLAALWRIASSPGAWTSPATGMSLIHHIQQVAHPVSSSITCSIIALVKSQYLCELLQGLSARTAHYWADPILPPETAVEPPSEVAMNSQSDGHGDAAAAASPGRWVWALDGRITEARLALVAEYLESCMTDTSSDEYPYEAVRTLQSIYVQATYDSIPSVVHATHQRRLANAIQTVFRIPSPSLPECRLRTVILHSGMFEPYTETPTAGIRTIYHAPALTASAGVDSPASRPWLDDDDARAKIKAAFTVYVDDLSTSDGDGDDAADVARVRVILDGFERLHPDLRLLVGPAS